MTDRYAVIGNPIAQSKSPLIHGMYAEVTGEDIEYTKIEGPLGGFAEAVDAFRASGGRGSTSPRRSSSMPSPMPPNIPGAPSWPAP
jgi:shikimate 5-dehydrogenase